MLQTINNILVLKYIIIFPDSGNYSLSTKCRLTFIDILTELLLNINGAEIVSCRCKKIILK